MSNISLDLFQPDVARWFSETFFAPTPPQRLGWQRIAARESPLILAPTGSRKTPDAFLCAIDSVIRAERSSEGNVVGVHTLFLSPLKALARGFRSEATRLLNGMDPANVFGDLFQILRPDGARHIIRHHPATTLCWRTGAPSWLWKTGAND